MSRELLERLQPERSEKYPDLLLRTLQRRVKIWRKEKAHAMVFCTPPAITIVKTMTRHPAGTVHLPFWVGSEWCKQFVGEQWSQRTPGAASRVWNSRSFANAMKLSTAVSMLAPPRGSIDAGRWPESTWRDLEAQFGKNVVDLEPTTPAEARAPSLTSASNAQNTRSQIRHPGAGQGGFA
ncbi:hypothetical protein ACWGTO_09865 [Mesorhizobium sp. PL10]